MSFYIQLFSEKICHHDRLIECCYFIEIGYFFELDTVQNDLTMICFYYTDKFVIISLIEDDLIRWVFWFVEMKDILWWWSLISDLDLKFSTKFMIDSDDLRKKYNFIDLKFILYFFRIGINVLYHFESDWNYVSYHGCLFRKHVHSILIWLPVIHLVWNYIKIY